MPTLATIFIKKVIKVLLVEVSTYSFHQIKKENNSCVIIFHIHNTIHGLTLHVLI